MGVKACRRRLEPPVEVSFCDGELPNSTAALESLSRSLARKARSAGAFSGQVVVIAVTPPFLGRPRLPFALQEVVEEVVDLLVEQHVGVVLVLRARVPDIPHWRWT